MLIKPSQNYSALFAGGIERPLNEKLPDKYVVKSIEITGGIELHRLAVEDFAQLERRSEEITGEIINKGCEGCDHENWPLEEVSQV